MGYMSIFFFLLSNNVIDIRGWVGGHVNAKTDSWCTFLIIVFKLTTLILTTLLQLLLCLQRLQSAPVTLTDHHPDQLPKADNQAKKTEHVEFLKQQKTKVRIR